MGELEQLLCLGKGLSGAPALAMGLGAPRYPPARVGEIPGVSTPAMGQGSWLGAPGFSPAIGRMPGAPQAMGQENFAGGSPPL